MEFTLVCDIMMNLEGSIRPAMYLANDLVARGYEVSMMSPIMSPDVERCLRMKEIKPLNLQVKHVTRNSSLSLLWFETWMHEAFLKLNSRRVSDDFCISINFSQVILTPSLIWYLQGPLSVALRDMGKELATTYRVVYNILRPVIEYADERLVKEMGKGSAFVVANSKFCASMYSKFGVEVQDIIYPPIDCEIFHPSTSSPPSSYVLTYFGKETRFSVIKTLADIGVKIKAFGSKMPQINRGLVGHPNIDFLGRISTSELVEAYSNALFTLFPFTHEPFGYVPLESMACGTPVLTYNMQGPRECVIHEHTGWLVNTDEKLTRKALELWKNGYSSCVRLNCVRAASKFDRRLYVEKWFRVLANFVEDKTTFPNGFLKATVV